MTYREQLESAQWKRFRQEILSRDNLQCQRCDNENLMKNCKGEALYRVDMPTNPEIDAFDTISGKRAYAPKTTGYSRNYFGYFSEYDSSERLEMILGISQKEVDYLGSLDQEIYKNEQFKKLKLTPEAWYRVLWQENEIKKIQHEIARMSRKRYYGDKPRKMELNPDEYKEYEKNRHKAKRLFLFVRGLHVHHKYYQIDKLAWQYPMNALTTLCWICHENLHKNEKIDVLDENGDVITRYDNCKRCFGAGEFLEYHHVEGGICFRCRGAKYEQLIDEK